MFLADRYPSQPAPPELFPSCREMWPNFNSHDLGKLEQCRRFVDPSGDTSGSRIECRTVTPFTRTVYNMFNYVEELKNQQEQCTGLPRN